MTAIKSILGKRDASRHGTVYMIYHLPGRRREDILTNMTRSTTVILRSYLRAARVEFLNAMQPSVSVQPSLVLQSGVGDNLPRIRVVCPRNSTAVLKGV